MFINRIPTNRAAAATLFAAAMFLAACGSSDEVSAPAATESSSEASSETTSSAGVDIGTATTDAGEVLTDDAGLSLYGFLPDEGGTPTCGGACADAWPPVMLPSSELPEGLDPAIFSVTDGVEGGSQLMAGGWPLYRFAGDAAEGDVNGQGSGDNWFLVAPDGSLITDESAASPSPSTDSSSTDASSTDGDGYSSGY